MLDTFNKGIILKKMPPPHMHTLFVELVQVQPGCDGTTSLNGSVSAPMHRPQVFTSHAFRASMAGASTMPPFSTTHHGPSQSISAIQHTSSGMSTFSASSSAPNGYATIPPPPWSRWGTMSTPSMPPSTQRRGGHTGGESSRANGTPQPSGPNSRKRKHVDEGLPPSQNRPQHMHHQQHPSEEDVRPSNSAFPLKRHAGPSLTPTPLSPPRPIQTLSPSLAMIVSPTNQAVHTSSSNQLPPLRNGTSGSPVLPPVKSLMGEPRPGSL